MEFVDSNCTKHAAVAVRRIYSLSTASLLAAVTAWNFRSAVLQNPMFFTGPDAPPV